MTPRYLRIAPLTAMAIFAVWPLLTFPFGFSATDGSGESIVYPGLVAVEVVAESADFKRINAVALTIDSRPLAVEPPVPGRRSVGVYAAVFRLREPLTRAGGTIRAAAPFVVNSRNLYAPPFDARARILMHRLTAGKGSLVIFLMAVAPGLFLGAVFALWKIPNEDPASAADAK